jgi:hypothetical protein
MKTGLAMLLMCLAPLLGQTLGTFTTTGQMVHSRRWHSTTLLFDGRVLIVGGWPDGDTAELYDPATATFAETGRLPPNHHPSSATLLPNGKVLVAGGQTADLYDPATGVFTPTGSPISPLFLVHHATLLPNGKVLISGGGPVVDQLYDPATGIFSWAGPHAVPPVHDREGAAARLSNGDVLIAGQPAAELYHPFSNTYSATGSMLRDARGYEVWHSAIAMLSNGKVLLTGGVGGDDWDGFRLDEAELYDPATGTFELTGSMQRARSWHTATAMPDGSVFVQGAAGYQSRETEVFDLSSKSFVSGGFMGENRYMGQATLLNDGRVLISGGASLTGALNTAEVYTPPSLTPAPVLLSISGDGRGQGAIQHANTFRIASAADPAATGDYLSIYLTGLQQNKVIPPLVSIGGKLAEVTFFGDVAAYPGLNIINVRVPSGITPGASVPVRLMYLNQISNEVTVGIR